MADSVGKISLDIDISSALDREIRSKSDEIGKSMTDALRKSFSSSTQKFKKTLQSMFSFPKRQFDQQVKSAQKSLRDNLKMPKDAFQMPKQTLNVSPFFGAGDQLSQTLNNVNQQIEIQQQKLAQLKQEYNEGLSDNVRHQIEQQEAIMKSSELRIEGLRSKLQELQHSYEVTVNPERKNKLVGEIAKTEAQMTTLIARSDKALHKIIQLEESMGREGKNALREKIVKTEASLLNLSKRAERIQADMHGTDKSMQKVASSAIKTEKPVNRLGLAFFGAGRRANTMGNQFVNAFKRIAKRVLIFSVIYRSIRTFQQYMSSAMRTNDQFSRSLDQVRTNLQVAFMPIFQVIMPALQSFMNWLAKVTTYIAAFISALFGKTYRESYQAAQGLNSARAAMDGFGASSKKAAKEAKEANRQLASFDEINTIADSSAGSDAGGAGGGGGAGGIAPLTPPDMDVTGIQAKMEKLASGIRNTFSKTWEAIKTGWQWTVDTFGPSLKNAWGNIAPELEKWVSFYMGYFEDIKDLGLSLGEWFVTDFVGLLQKAIELSSLVLAGFLESYRMVVEDIWNALFPIYEKLINEGLPRLTEYLDGWMDIFYQIFEITKGIFDDIWQGAIAPALEIISQIIQDALDIIFEWWDTWGVKILGNIKESLAGIKKLWDNLWNGFLKPFISNMLTLMKDLWDNHLKHLVKEIGDFVGKLYTSAQEILNKFILPIVNLLVQKLGPVFNVIFSAIGGYVASSVAIISDIIRGLLNVFGGLIDFITGVFTGNWRKAWQGLADIFRGIADTLVAIIKAPLNGIIGLVNGAIKGLNKIKVPSWVPGLGGKGINIPQIPRLAKGGIIDQPTIAMVGEAGKEAVMPLENNTGWINNLAGQIANQMGGTSSANDESVTILREIVDVLLQILNALLNNDHETVLKVNETELGRVVAKAINNLSRQAGKSVILV